jgi:hypothetical protein
MKIVVIADTQRRPDNVQVNTPLDIAIGNMIVEEQPDVVVHIGDHFDMPSLSTYDIPKNNRRTIDGREVAADVAAGRESMGRILAPLRDLQERQRNSKHRVYRPRMVFTLGNHEERILRFPELRGLVGISDLFAGTPWEVYDYLEPVTFGGVEFVHYAANPLSGRPYGGSAEYRLNKTKMSLVQGHEQTFKYAMEFLNNGRALSFLVGGACYLHDEPYKGPQGNNHFRGAFILHNVKDGVYDLEQVSCARMMEEYL